MECMLGYEPKSHHFEDDVCHSVDPDIHSVDEMCVRTNRPTIEFVLDVFGWSI
jgi:hypothetical protein